MADAVTYIQRSCLFHGASVPCPLAAGGGGIRPYVLPLDVVGGRLAPGPSGGSLEAAADAQGAVVEAEFGTAPTAPLAQGALVEGIPLGGCEFDVC